MTGSVHRTIHHGGDPAQPGVSGHVVTSAGHQRDCARVDQPVPCPVAPELMARLARGEFPSRRAFYRAAGGRTRHTVDWLDRHGFLMPATRNREDVRRALRRRARQLGRLPEESEVEADLVAAARRKFGSWAEGLFQATGDPGLDRFGHLADEDLLGLIREYACRHQRLPKAHLFDGVVYPPAALYTARFGVRTWDEVLALVDLTGVRTFDQGGWGTVRVDRGHVYLSHRAYLIGRYLTDQGIAFRQSVPAGDGSGFTFDFYLPERDCYVIVHGAGKPEPQAVITARRVRDAGSRVVEIFPHDNTVGTLATEVQRL